LIHYTLTCRPVKTLYVGPIISVVDDDISQRHASDRSSVRRSSVGIRYILRRELEKYGIPRTEFMYADESVVRRTEYTTAVDLNYTNWEQSM